MRVLTTAQQINQELTRLIGGRTSCRIAVAWASANFPAFHLLRRNASKIERMVVGTHFYQTDPDFIEAFLSNDHVRFLRSTDDVFHPKVYLFEMQGGGWEAVVGSPNFTRAGLSHNAEVAVLMTDADIGARQARDDLVAAIDGYWPDDEHAFTPGDLPAYREAYRRRQPTLRRLGGHFGPPQGADDGGRSPLEIPVCRLTWQAYYAQLLARGQQFPQHCSIQHRLDLLQAVRDLFAAANGNFAAVPEDGRRQIAGLTTTEAIDFHLFGSTNAVGYFWQAVNANNDNLSQALALIPAAGDVSREQYLAYVERFQHAFPHGHDGVGIASRLLTMKRPDLFVCLNDGNMAGICDEFGLSHYFFDNQNTRYARYWDSVIERIREAVWWGAQQPEDETERQVWQAKAAFLDCIYYNG